MIEIKQISRDNLSLELIEALVPLLQQLSSSVTFTLVEHAITSSQNHILIALETEESNKIVGTATMGYLNCVTGVRVHIEDVVVDSDYRRKGIAALLINEAIERANKIKAKSIDLTSRPEREAANRLYRKLGFVKRDTNVYRYANHIQ
jgi:ribosomal protein S18 acetylase RimI-like enzyme